MADLVPYSQAATTSLVSTLQNSDLMALAREDNQSDTGYRSKVTRVDTIAKKVVKETDYSDLQTNSKNPIGAINEVNAKASQFDNMTATASGSIATFTDGGDDIPVSEYECEIVAQQASGTPTPDNPLPISGFSQADIAVCGINLWDEQWELGTLNWTDGSPVSSTSYFRSKNYISCKPNTTYRAIVGNGITLYAYDENKVFTRRVLNSQSSQNFTTQANECYLRFRTFTEETTYQNNISLNYPSSDTQYHAYKGNTYLVEFGQTIYGGRLIYKNGQWSIEATHGYICLYDYNWNYNSNYDLFETGEITGKYYLSEFICTHYDCSMVSSVGAIPNYSGLLRQSAMYIKNTDYTDATQFKNSLTDTYMVYELATPVIIPITSSTRVKTISGVNNIFSNTGDNSVKYFTENADSLAELIKAFVL